MSEKLNNVEVDVDERVVRGDYANLAIISHSPTEFVLDFAAMLPGMSKPKVSNRVVVTPEHAKRIFNSLKDNLQRYEEHFGTISSPESLHSQQQDGFRGLGDLSHKIGEA